jgi:DNA-directed RNA polymerase alpha subunit
MIDLTQLEISTRATNALLGAGYIHADDLTCKTPRHIMDVHGIGYGSLKQIERALLKFGLRLGMTGPAYGESFEGLKANEVKK